MSEVPLYLGTPGRTGGRQHGQHTIQGYLAHKKPSPPRTLQ
jgi:hypothetical protein